MPASRRIRSRKAPVVEVTVIGGGGGGDGGPTVTIIDRVGAKDALLTVPFLLPERFGVKDVQRWNIAEGDFEGWRDALALTGTPQPNDRLGWSDAVALAISGQNDRVGARDSVTWVCDYFSAGTGFTFTVPTGVTALRAECWGGGGNGGSAAVGGGGGGGGGAYARLNAMAVTPGSVHPMQVAAAGQLTYFSSLTTVLARTGQNGGAGSTSQGAGGAGGLASTSIGDVAFNGGAGGGGGGLGTLNGGGGGGGAGSTGAGGAGAGGGGAGSGTSIGGGPGGTGGATTTPGGVGAQAGGGGGGASSLAAAGAGAIGRVRVTFTL